MRERPGWRKVAIAGSLALLTFSPLLNLPVTVRVADALAGKSVDCSSGELTNAPYPYGVIAVPGAGGEIDGNGQPQPNTFENRRLTAAALAYINGFAPQVILLDGPGSLGETDKEYLQNQVWTLSGGKKELPGGSVFLDSVSVNTATNMDVLKAFMEKYGLSNALIVTDQFHLDRAMIMACIKKINSKGLSVESLAKMYNKAFSEIVQEEDGEDVVKSLTESERLKILWLPYDPDWLIPTAIKETFNR